MADRGVVTVTAVHAGLLGAVFAAGLLLVVAGWYGTPASTTGAGAPRRWWPGGRAPRRPPRRAVPAAAVASGVAAYAVTGVPAVGLLVAAAVPGLPWLWNVGRVEERAIARVEALTDWTRRLKDQISTGAGLVSAVVATAGSAPAPITTEVGALARRLQAGTDPDRALRGFAGDLADQVVAALLLHLRDRGQHLAEVLAAVARDAAAQVAMRREVHARRTQPRHTVRFMTVFGLVVALLLARADLLAVYTSPGGQVVLVVLAGLFVATLAWVRAMSRPPVQPRFLGGED